MTTRDRVAEHVWRVITYADGKRASIHFENAAGEQIDVSPANVHEYRPPEPRGPAQQPSLFDMHKEAL